MRDVGSPGRSLHRVPRREQIVQTAMQILDDDGLAGLSMRKLAAKLASNATSLYWHVQTKDDLIDLLIDEVYGEVDVPEPELAGWRAGALLFAHSLHAAVVRHAWLPEVIYTRPSIGPNAMSIGSRGLLLFGSAGFAGPDIDYATAAVMSYVLGQASAEVTCHKRPEMQEAVRWRPSVHPAPLLNESFTFGLESLLDGLEARAKLPAS